MATRGLLFVGETKSLTDGEKSVFFFWKNKEILDAELWAISDVLDVATNETLNAKDTPIVIFCDS